MLVLKYWWGFSSSHKMLADRYAHEFRLEFRLGQRLRRGCKLKAQLTDSLHVNGSSCTFRVRFFAMQTPPLNWNSFTCCMQSRTLCHHLHNSQYKRFFPQTKAFNFRLKKCSENCVFKFGRRIVCYSSLDIVIENCVSFGPELDWRHLGE